MLASLSPAGTYVFVDIILNILPPMLFGTTGPYERLVVRMPIRNILSVLPQVSMYSFIVVQVTIYYLVSCSLTSQPWYVQCTLHSEHPFLCSNCSPYLSPRRYVPLNGTLNNIMQPPTNQLSYALFSANMMSYVISAIIFAPGPPYRGSFFSNSKYCSDLY